MNAQKAAAQVAPAPQVDATLVVLTTPADPVLPVAVPQALAPQVAVTTHPAPQAQVQQALVPPVVALLAPQVAVAAATAPHPT